MDILYDISCNSVASKPDEDDELQNAYSSSEVVDKATTSADIWSMIQMIRIIQLVMIAKIVIHFRVSSVDQPTYLSISCFIIIILNVEYKSNINRNH